MYCRLKMMFLLSDSPEINECNLFVILYIGRTYIVNTECSSSVCLHSIVLMSVH
jgi:hypothetical protein